MAGRSTLKLLRSKTLYIFIFLTINKQYLFFTEFYICNKNEYQEYFLMGKGGWCVGLTTLSPSCADFLEIWKPQTPGTLRVRLRL